MKNYFTPSWLTIAFSFAIIIPPILIALLASKHAPTTDKRKVLFTILGFFAIYYSYILILALNGAYNVVTLPPKILLITTLPYALFLFGWVYRLKMAETIVQNTPLPSLISIHIFRLIGVTFITLALYKALPKPFALIAGLGDIITAITSIWVAKIVTQKVGYAKKLAIAWNTFGLADIIITAVLANIITKISIDTGAMGVDTLTKIPYCIIPAFAPPTIIFIHVLIYKKIKANL